jgi:hypothetical protein
MSNILGLSYVTKITSLLLSLQLFETVTAINIWRVKLEKEMESFLGLHVNSNNFWP